MGEKKNPLERLGEGSDEKLDKKTARQTEIFILISNVFVPVAYPEDLYEVSLFLCSFTKCWRGAAEKCV